MDPTSIWMVGIPGGGAANGPLIHGIGRPHLWKILPTFVYSVLKGFSYRKTTLFHISSVRWKGCSEESSETWGTECTQGSGFRDCNLLWKAFSFWMLCSLSCTLLAGGNPAAGPTCALKKRVPCPSTRIPPDSECRGEPGCRCCAVGSRWLEAVPGRILQAALQTGALKRSLQGVQKR